MTQDAAQPAHDALLAASAEPVPGSGTRASGALPAELWQAVERDYRAGRFSIRELGRLHGVSEAAIRGRARRGAWQHDLVAKVEEMALNALSKPVPPEPAREALMREVTVSQEIITDDTIIEQAAATVVQVVRSHRVRIRQGLDLIELLTKQLIDVAGRRDEFESDIEQECFEDKGVERRNRLMKAVALGTHASIASSLAGALKTWISLERQAFNIPEDVSAEAPKAATVEAQTPEEAYLRMIGR